jgi:hypothetical protein
MFRADGRHSGSRDRDEQARQLPVFANLPEPDIWGASLVRRGFRDSNRAVTGGGHRTNALEISEWRYDSERELLARVLRELAQ